MTTLNLLRTTMRMWTAAVAIADAVRDEFAAGITGVRWRRPARRCPAWCARGHHCTAQHGYPSGQHRSEPAVWETSYGKLIALRIAGLDQSQAVELRPVVSLPDASDAVADRYAQQILTAVHLAITAVIANASASGDPIRAGVDRPELASYPHPPAAVPAARRPALTGGHP